MSLRLLMSARDPGTALHLGPVALLAAREDDIELTVAASPPAFEALAAIPGLTVRPFSVAPVQSAGEAGPLLDGARALLDDVRPDAVLVGLSGPGAGIDEALAACADGIPTFLFQDFWGDLNTLLGSPNLTVLALDPEAVRITRSRHGLGAVAVGAPGYERFAELDTDRLAACARRELELGDGAPLLTVCGQPLWEVDGYASTLRSVGRAAREAGLPTVAWRPHPKESPQQRARGAELLGSDGAVVLDAHAPSLESLLATSDVLCSAFSNCGADLVHLGRAATSPLGSVVFALFEPGLRDQYRRWTGLDDLPLTTAGLARTARRVQDLPGALRRAAQPDERRTMWERAARQLPDPAGAARRVLACIRRSLEEG